MSTKCPPAPKDKKAYVTELGKILVKDYGKKKYYKPEEVKKANRKTPWYDIADFGCWGMSVYTSHSDFDAYHAQTGEACDYVAMKSEMISGMSAADSISLADLADVDIDASWLDFGDVFESIFEGIGAIITSIFD